MGPTSGRVLVVDDELHVRELLRDFLTTVGDEVATAATGAEALEVVPTFLPDVILVDMLMPGMSGADVLEALRRAGVTVPVILITGQPITMPEGREDVESGRSDVLAPALLRSGAVNRRAPGTGRLAVPGTATLQ